jgi:hypothetical protein
LRYWISLRNSDGILRAKVALQYFLRLSASATTFALRGKFLNKKWMERVLDEEQLCSKNFPQIRNGFGTKI